jgi:hypothetical protein
MNMTLPSPAGGLFLGQSRVFEPSLVQEFGRTVGETAPRQRWDRIDHDPELGF